MSATSQALQDIITERHRQQAVEGWTPGHDDQHASGQLAIAAACYALAAVLVNFQAMVALLWPWADAWWKPKGPRRNLVRAGALIAAEIERRDRLMLDAPEEGGPANVPSLVVNPDAMHKLRAVLTHTEPNILIIADQYGYTIRRGDAPSLSAAKLTTAMPFTNFQRAVLHARNTDYVFAAEPVAISNPGAASLIEHRPIETAA